MHHLHKTEDLNENQYGFTPQQNTIDAAMEARKSIEPQLEKGRVVIMVSLDVRGAFDSTWWPVILNGLPEAKCPRNFYSLTNINNFNIEKRINKGCPQGSCFGPGLWNIQYNPILNLRHTKHKKYSLCR
jgi:hypothetical protein